MKNIWDMYFTICVLFMNIFGFIFKWLYKYTNYKGPSKWPMQVVFSLFIFVLKFQWQWLIGISSSKTTLNSSSCHKLDNSKSKFVNSFPSEEEWKGVFSYLCINYFFKQHIHKKTLNTFFTNLHTNFLKIES